MNDEDKNSIIALENFLRKTKGNKIQIQQPIKVKYQDIFSEDEKDITIDKKENENNKSKDKLKSIKKPNFNKIKKYNVVKESIVFKDIDAKKSIINISNAKDEFNNLLYNTVLNNNIINSNQNIIHKKTNDYFRKKSTINFDEIYQTKLKNVRDISIFK